MRAHLLARLLPAVLCALAACTEPQTPVSEGTGTATAVPTITEAPTGASSVTSAPTAAAPDKLEAPYVLTFRQSGGIAGMMMEAIVDTGAKSITYGGLRNQKPETKELSADEIGRITRSLEEARYASFPGK